jgi:hypothetical protein
MVYAIEIHEILENIFDDVRGIRKDNQLKVCCPKCQERDGLLYPDGKYNLEINTKLNMFHCWKCESPKFSGTIGKLIKMYGSNYDYKLYKSYSRIYYNNTQYIGVDENNNDEYISNIKLPNEFISFEDLNFNNLKHLKMYNYWVLDRKLPIETAIKYNVGFCVEGDYADRIVVPSYDQFGDINYFVSRLIYESDRNPKYKNPDQNKEMIIFNENKINWDSTVYIVEGVFDMFSLPPNVIVLLGKKLYNLIFQKIREKKPNIVLVLDPDAIKDSINIYREILSIYGYNIKNKIKIVLIDNKKMDIDDLRKKGGKEEVLKLLYKAKELDFDKLNIFE